MCLKIITYEISGVRAPYNVFQWFFELVVRTWSDFQHCVPSDWLDGWHAHGIDLMTM